ncbi:Uu.00g104220.m01.CDS01 [Anthostomella pinea]|uniref:Uu.00g104220.m01.CDS01 n=1 Tax=Anthostomella pinea TaxID=933095 RepID=A0AAI8YFK7_9PEZI|nr:Uu.00g104220.m01.CDS01 [Anthostomella pinea]
MSQPGSDSDQSGRNTPTSPDPPGTKAGFSLPPPGFDPKTDGEKTRKYYAEQYKKGPLDPEDQVGESVEEEIDRQITELEKMRGKTVPQDEQDRIAAKIRKVRGGSWLEALKVELRGKTDVPIAYFNRLVAEYEGTIPLVVSFRAKAEKDVADKDKTIKDLKKQLDSGQASSSDPKLEKENSDLKSENESLTKENNDLKDQLEKLQGELKDCQKHGKTLQAQVNDLEKAAKKAKDDSSEEEGDDGVQKDSLSLDARLDNPLHVIPGGLFDKDAIPAGMALDSMAKQYKAYRELEQKYDDLRNREKDLKDQLEAAQKAALDADKRIARLNEELAAATIKESDGKGGSDDKALKAEIKKLEAELEKLKKDYHDLDKHYELQKHMNSKQTKDVWELIDLRKQFKQLQDKLKACEEDKDDPEEDVVELNERIEELKAELVACKASKGVDPADIPEELKALRRKLAQRDSIENGLNHEIIRLKDRIRELLEDLNRAQAAMKPDQIKEATLRKAIDRLKRQIKDITVRNQQLQRTAVAVVVRDSDDLRRFWELVEAAWRKLGAVGHAVDALYKALGLVCNTADLAEAINDLVAPAGSLKGKFPGFATIELKKELATARLTIVNLRRDLANARPLTDAQIKMDLKLYEEEELERRVDRRTATYRNHRRAYLDNLFGAAREYQVLEATVTDEPTRNEINRIRSTYLDPNVIPAPVAATGGGEYLPGCLGW